MDIISRYIGKLFYGTFFVVLLPGLLFAWGRKADTFIPLPVPNHHWFTWIILGMGALLVVSAWIALARYGHGLPMNAYPPKYYVARGIYRFVAHPIYVGFVILCLGMSILWRSPGSLWLVTPMIALASAGLVLGYEKHDLHRRFGEVPRPLISLAPNQAGPPGPWQRLSVFIIVFLPWLITYQAIIFLGTPPDAINAHFEFESSWPVLVWTELIYGSTYLFVITVPLFVQSQKVLRRFSVMGLISTLIVTVLYLVLPLVSPPRPFDAQSILGQVLQLEQTMSSAVASFPSFHVIWSLIAAEAWSANARSMRIVAWSWAILISLSCITTGMHAIIDIAAGVFIYVTVRNSPRIWRALLSISQRLANSWKEWRWRELRLINHAFFAILAATTGFWIASALGGPDLVWQLLLIHVFALLGAGLWAQKLEGSSRLSRPFGYYGSVLGGLCGSLIAAAIGGNLFLLLTLVAIEAPWVQAIGRCRCLVQGCCHGREATKHTGIRYWKAKSRVVAYDRLKGVPLFPTPLYSFLANIVIGVLLLRLWYLDAPLNIISGGYLLLSSVARFVEESYRGEPQTPYFLGLAIYQWLAILTFLCGAIVTVIPGGAAPHVNIELNSNALLIGILYGLAAGFSMGVDFPNSAKRFARLAPP